MKIKLKFAGLVWLTAVAALLVLAVGASGAGASAFKAPGGFPVEFSGEGLGKSTFLSSGLNFVSCEHSQSKGSVLNSTLAKVIITYLTNCVTGGLAAGTCPTITTHELLLTPLSKLNGGTKTGLLVLPKSGTELASFSCSTGLGTLSVKIKGAVVCESTIIDILTKQEKVICKAGLTHGAQEFTSGTDPTGKVVGGTLTAESNLGFFKITEKDSQATTKDWTYSKEVEQIGEIEPLPNKTLVTEFANVIEGNKEVPVIDWSKENPMMTHGCKGGTVTIRAEGENPKTKELEHREATLTETPSGSEEFDGNIPVMEPIHGAVVLKITISGCAHETENVVIEINIYCDPSGTVVDENHEDAPVWEATVTLLLSTTETGTYTAVPNGSEVMSPMNRVNPDLTREDGSFGWDVIEDWYKVDATKTGCGSASTTAFKVPPPQENLLITLHCEGEQWKLGEETGEKAQLAVTAPATKCAGNVRVENVSFGGAVIKVLKETGIECTIKTKGCEAKELKKGQKCESELEKPGTKPEYELEVEWKAKKFTKKFAV